MSGSTDEHYERCDSFTSSEVASGLCELCHEPEDQHDCERRERYAAAIRRACGNAYASNSQMTENEIAAVAAMAVADAEFAAGFERNTKLLAENARLREELESFRLSLDAANVHGAKLTEENARLREANEYLHDLVDALGRDKRLSDEIGSKYLTTIERVRALLDLRERLDDPVSRYLAAELRAALDGGSDV